MKHIATFSLGLVTLMAGYSALAITPPANPPAKTAAAPASAGPPSKTSSKILELDWEELLPKKERENFSLEPPPPLPGNHGYLDESAPGAIQYGSSEVNKELNGVMVKMPGFIVPLEMGKNGVIREFLLVPYFGACIHVPPPPPNQIVFVRMKQGISVNSIYDAQWITGRLKTSVFESQYGSAAYSLEGDKAEAYKY